MAVTTRHVVDTAPAAADVVAAATALRERQRPVKEGYRQDPESAQVASTATARVDQAGLTATVPTWSGEVVAGLHPAAGGDGSQACSADIVLQALVACAGVTLSSVATALGVELRSATVSAHGSWDARGTLGLSREAPVGLTGVELVLDRETDADEGTVDRLLELTERYCVVARTLQDRRSPSAAPEASDRLGAPAGSWSLLWRARRDRRRSQ